MKILRCLGKFFSGFLIFLALAVSFTGLFIQYSLDNLDVIAESAEKNLPGILQENKALFAEKMSKALEIDKGQLQRTCNQDPEQFTEDFCAKLGTLETEEEIRNELVDVMIVKLQDQMQPEVEEFEQALKSRMGLIGDYLKYSIPVGLFILLLGSLLIFLVEKFKCIPTTYYVSLKVGFIAGFMSIGNFFLMTLSSGKMEEVASTLPMIKEGDSPALALKLMSALLTDWLNVVGGKLFMVSVAVAVVSFATAGVMFILKRKKKQGKIPVVKKEPEAKKEMNAPIVKKKSKIVFKKKK